MRRILIIFNPVAGRRRRTPGRLLRIVAALEALGCPVAVRVTAGPGDAERLARDAEPGFDVVVAAGGDGTINQVANGLWSDDPTRVPRCLGVLPFGTANVLAREIALPRRAGALAKILAFSAAQPIWPGYIGGRVFLMMAGSGFDADVVAAVDPALKRRLGRAAFVWAILLHLCRLPQERFTIGCDDIEHGAASVIVAKGRRYAGRFVLAPTAALGEPLLHVVLFDRGGRLAALRYLLALPLGLLPRLKEVRIVAARRVAISGGTASLVQTDGEVYGRLPVDIGVAPLPLMLVRPDVRCPARV